MGACLLGSVGGTGDGGNNISSWDVSGGTIGEGGVGNVSGFRRDGVGVISGEGVGDVPGGSGTGMVEAWPNNIYTFKILTMAIAIFSCYFE